MLAWPGLNMECGCAVCSSTAICNDSDAANGTRVRTLGRLTADVSIADA